MGYVGSMKKIKQKINLITTKEAAERLDMTLDGVRRLIRIGRLPVVEVGTIYLIDPDDLIGIKKANSGRPRKAVAINEQN